MSAYQKLLTWIGLIFVSYTLPLYAGVYKVPIEEQHIIFHEESFESLSLSEKRLLFRLLVDAECSKHFCGEAPCQKAKTSRAEAKQKTGKIRTLDESWLQVEEGTHVFLTELICTSDISLDLTPEEGADFIAIVETVPLQFNEITRSDCFQKTNKSTVLRPSNHSIHISEIETQLSQLLNWIDTTHTPTAGAQEVIEFENKLIDVHSYNEVKRIFAILKEKNYLIYNSVKQTWTTHLRKKISELDLSKLIPFSEGSTKTAFLLNANGVPAILPQEGALILLVAKEATNPLIRETLERELISLKKLQDAGLPTAQLVESESNDLLFTLKNSHIALIEEYIPNSMSYDLKRSENGLTSIDKKILIFTLLGQKIDTSEAGISRTINIDRDSKMPNKARILKSIQNLFEQFKKISEYKNRIIDLQIQIQIAHTDQPTQVKIIDPLDVVDISHEKDFAQSKPELLRKINSTQIWLSQMTSYLKKLGEILEKENDPTKRLLDEIAAGFPLKVNPTQLLDSHNMAKQLLERKPNSLKTQPGQRNLKRSPLGRPNPDN